MQTVDFFTPIVDDPRQFGRIAAANALSDVYAMGGRPITCLNLLCFPEATLPVEVMGEILAGGHEIAHEAGAVVLGGHTVVDTELKYGMSVTGLVHPDHITTKGGAKGGDVLFLTKPLGTGILTTALKKQQLSEELLAQVTAQMSQLNRRASEIMMSLGARCATDITGYGLLGHGLEIARASGVMLEIAVDRLPLLPTVRTLAKAGCVTGGGGKNGAHVNPWVKRSSDFPDDLWAVLVDPQTSGGLFICLPAQVADEATRAFQAAGLPVTGPIGRVLEDGVGITLV